MNLAQEALQKPTQEPKDEFVGVLRNLVHNLSQPLTSLQGSLEVALLGEMDEAECRNVFEQSLEEAHRIALALGTLREVLEAEDPGEDFRPVCWESLITKVLQDVAPLTRVKGLQLVFEPLADTFVEVNPLRVENVMRELLRQVVRQGPRKRVIRIGLSVHENTALLSVCDDVLTSEVTARSEKVPPISSLPAACQGRQLTWWILRRSIECQGGRLEVEELSRGGVCCRVYLPLASSEAAKVGLP